MLRISKLADYATGIMNHLAHYPEHVFSATEIAHQVHITVPTVSKILKLLLEAGLVVSSRGAEGGYRIARSAQEISIAQIITAIEGAPALTECSQHNLCTHDAICTMKGNWQTINRFILNALQSLTLADMAKPLHMPGMKSMWAETQLAEE